MATRTVRLTGQALQALPGDLAQIKNLEELYAGANRQA